MKNCPKCNTENNDSAKFCNECGTRFESLPFLGKNEAVRTFDADDTIAVPAFLRDLPTLSDKEPSNKEDTSTSEEPSEELTHDIYGFDETASNDEHIVDDDSEELVVNNEITEKDSNKTLEESENQTDQIEPDHLDEKTVQSFNDFSGLGIFADGSKAESTAKMPKVPEVENDSSSTSSATPKKISAPSNRKEERARAKELKQREREARRAMKNKDEATTSHANVIIIIASIAVAVAIALAFAYGFELIGGKTIPDTSGMSEADAVYTLQQAGFNTRVSMVKSDDTEGLVLLTDPNSGTRVAKGSEVVVHVAQSRTIPSVKGLNTDAALAALRESGYTNISEVEYTKTNDVDDGIVVNVSPNEGDKVKSVYPVTITAAQNYRVPDVRGMTEANATYTLRQAGYYVYLNSVENESLEAGTVYTTEPSANEKLDPDKYVTIYVVQHRSTRLEQLATNYLTSQGKVTISGVTYRVDSVSSTTYQSNGVVSFTIMGSPTTSFLGESVTLGSRSVSGSITFNDNDEVIGVG